MNEHAGPACALSGLIVAVFAILLHDKNPAPPLPARTEVVEPRRGEGLIPDPHAAILPPQPAPVARPSPVVAKSPSSPRSLVAGPKSPVPTGLDARRKPIGGEVPPSPSKARSAPPSPRPPFTVVESGESLADVASRVYGSKDSVGVLWRANRDQVERVDSELARGTLLRTP